MNDRPRKTHYLKTWSEYFKPLASGAKTFEIRNNDRQFAVGDVIVCEEYNPAEKWFTGNRAAFTVTYITDFAQRSGYVVLGIKPLKPAP